MSKGRMPVLFAGHGSPDMTLGENRYTEKWRELGQLIGKAEAIVVVSAHWMTGGETLLTASPHPGTIYDFGGFPDELYRIRYNSPGHPALVEKIIEKLEGFNIKGDSERGYDHGSWTILRHMYPDADVPVIQLSLDLRQDGAWHFELGRNLRWLREEGVLLMGSGNFVHNLRMLTFPEVTAADWAVSFDEEVKNLILDGEYEKLKDYQALGEKAIQSIPTAEHYLPLLYTLGLSDDKDRITFPIEGISFGVVSMRTVLFS